MNEIQTQPPFALPYSHWKHKGEENLASAEELVLDLGPDALIVAYTCWTHLTLDAAYSIFHQNIESSIEMSLYHYFSVLLEYQGAAHPRERYNKVCHRETITYPKLLRSAVILVMREKEGGCYSEPLAWLACSTLEEILLTPWVSPSPPQACQLIPQSLPRCFLLPTMTHKEEHRLLHITSPLCSLNLC